VAIAGKSSPNHKIHLILSNKVVRLLNRRFFSTGQLVDDRNGKIPQKSLESSPDQVHNNGKKAEKFYTTCGLKNWATKSPKLP
jgi:hypothetical protein